MELQIVNPQLGFSKVALVEPTERGYVYLAARVQRSPTPWVLPSAKRARLLRLLKPLARDVAALDGVLRANVFRAIVKPPTARFSAYLKARGRSLHVADFDVLVLIETRSRELADRIRESPAFLALRSLLEREAERPLRHFWHQLAKKGFWHYVTANLEANHAGSMPIYCRLA